MAKDDLPPSEKLEKRAAAKLKSVLGSYIKDIQPELEEIERTDGTETFCLVPSMKDEVLKSVKGRLDKELQHIAVARQKSEEVDLEENYDLVRYLHSLGEALKRVPACDVGEVEDIISAVQEGYPPEGMSYEDFIDSLIVEKAERKTSRNKEQREKFKKKIQENMKDVVEDLGKPPEKLTKNDLRLAQEEATKRAAEETSGLKENNFIMGVRRSLFGKLQYYMHNGATGQKKEMPSPCGLKIPMKGDTAIGKSEDILAFFGSTDDWKDFYVEGKDKVEGQTFHRMHPDDWPGCFGDIFENLNAITDEELEKRLKKVNKEQGTKLKVDDFAVDQMHVGYS